MRWGSSSKRRGCRGATCHSTSWWVPQRSTESDSVLRDTESVSALLNFALDVALHSLAGGLCACTHQHTHVRHALGMHAMHPVTQEGEAPEEVGAVLQQRSRWAKGHMQVFFGRHCPLIQPNLSLVHKILYTNGERFWAGHCVRAHAWPCRRLLRCVRVLFGLAPCGRQHGYGTLNMVHTHTCLCVHSRHLGVLCDHRLHLCVHAHSLRQPRVGRAPRGAQQQLHAGSHALLRGRCVHVHVHVHCVRLPVLGTCAGHTPSVYTWPSACGMARDWVLCCVMGMHAGAAINFNVRSLAHIQVGRAGAAATAGLTIGHWHWQSARRHRRPTSTVAASCVYTRRLCNTTARACSYRSPATTS
jgi:hypothetical protein